MTHQSAADALRASDVVLVAHLAGGARFVHGARFVPCVPVLHNNAWMFHVKHYQQRTPTVPMFHVKPCGLRLMLGSMFHVKHCCHQIAHGNMFHVKHYACEYEHAVAS